jgi:hypothetical protein
MSQKFKVLMYCGRFVNMSLLHKGIYESLAPVVYTHENSIQSLVDTAKAMVDGMGYSYVERYIENLKRCELVTVELKQIKP